MPFLDKREGLKGTGAEVTDAQTRASHGHEKEGRPQELLPWWAGNGPPSKETADAKMHLRIRMLVVPLRIMRVPDNRQIWGCDKKICWACQQWLILQSCKKYPLEIRSTTVGRSYSSNGELWFMVPIMWQFTIALDNARIFLCNHFIQQIFSKIHLFIYLAVLGLNWGSGTPLQCSCLENPMDGGAYWAAVHGVSKSRTWLSDFAFTFLFDALEKAMATHSSILAWRIPWIEEPGGLQSMGSLRVSSGP